MEALRVLVVGDDIDLVEDMCASLARCGHHTIAAATMAEAKAALEAHAPAAIICDWNLAGGRATWLLQLARERHPRVGRVLLTGVVHDDRSLLLARNLVHVALIKPIDPDELCHAVDIARAASKD